MFGMPLSWFLILLCSATTNAQCSSTQCPTGGIWSEWTTTGVCATTCGACSSLSYTRTCLSTGMNNCACTGASTITQVCNTQACNYPRADASGVTCCQGTPMVYNNWYHCGPLNLNTTLSCCPTGGYWTTWSSWSKVADQIAWTRSRSCISGGFACPCTGDSVETKYTCPCQAISVITADNNGCSSVLSGMTPYSVRTPVNLGSQCLSMFVLEASNFRQLFYTVVDGATVTSVGVVHANGTCSKQAWTTGTTGTDGQFTKIYFTCNVDTGYFYGYDFTDIVGIAQFY